MTKTLNIHQEFVLNNATVSLLLLAQRGVQAITGNPPAASRALLADALAPLLGGAVETPAPALAPVVTESALFQAELRAERLQSAFDSLVSVAKAGDPLLRDVRIDDGTGDLVCDYGPQATEDAERASFAQAEADRLTASLAVPAPIVIDDTTDDETLESVGLERVEETAAFILPAAALEHGKKLQAAMDIELKERFPALDLNAPITADMIGGDAAVDEIREAAAQRVATTADEAEEPQVDAQRLPVAEENEDDKGDDASV